MENKTCGECKHFEVDVVAATCEKKLWICDDNTPACKGFEPKTITNGDKIRQGGDYALAYFKSEQRCDVCAYAAPIDTAPACRRPEGKTCFDGMLVWLNAPADCVAKVPKKARGNMKQLSFRIYDKNFHGNWGSRLGVFILCSSVDGRLCCIEQSSFGYSERGKAIEWAKQRIKEIDCNTCLFKWQCKKGSER